MKKIIYFSVISVLAMTMAAAGSYVNLKSSDVKNANQDVASTAQEVSKITFGITVMESVTAIQKLKIPVKL